MKKVGFIVYLVLGCCLALLMCEGVWADGEHQGGDENDGNGNCSCDGKSPICSLTCTKKGLSNQPVSNGGGEAGGGRSWRVYKVTEKTDTLKEMNEGASWPAVSGKYNGEALTILKDCAKKGAPYIAIMGLNSITVENKNPQEFYIVFTETARQYYTWNTYGAIAKKEKVKNAKNGQAITSSVAEELYKDEFGNTKDFAKVGAFCTWAGQYTLTAYARTEDGKLLNSGNAIDSKKVDKGKDAKVKMKPISGYTFTGWSTAKKGAATQTGNEYSKSNMKANAVVYAVYKKEEITVTLSGIAIDISGQGLGASCNPAPKTVSKGSSATINSKPCTGYTVLGWSTTNPGMPSGNTASYTVSSLNNDTTVYIIYEKKPIADCPEEYGISIPSSYTNSDIWGGVTSTATRIKNDNVGNTWQTSFVFVRPGHTVSWAHCYFPGVQTVADSIFNGNTIKNLINPFENKYDVSRSDNAIVKNCKPWSGTIGDAGGKSCTDPGYPITSGMVGSGVTEMMTTGRPTNVSVATDGSGYTIEEASAFSSSAAAYVPYNFINTASVDGNEYYYAGEDGMVKSSITTSPKANKLTSPDEDYATIVRYAKREVKMCYDDGTGEKCDVIKSGDFQVNSSAPKNTLNPTGKLRYVDPFNEEISFTVPDLPAGSKVCFISRVYPANSGPENNVNSTGSGTWAESDRYCVPVAKRPSIQAWGGNVYSSGAIKTSRSVKQDLYGSNNSKKPYIFGSWGELGVISAGKVSGFASGASLGYKNNGGRAWPEYAGNTDGYALGSDYPGGGFGSSDFCRYSVLTFPNSDCASGSVGGAGNSNSTKSINDNKDVLKSLIDVNMENKNREAYDVEYIDGFNDDGNTWIVKTNGELNISGGMLAKDTFKLLSANDNIIVNGDIKIADDVVLENFDQAPKVVLYSKKDIKINCNVTRLDAILVAEGSVITCNNLGDPNKGIYERIKEHINDGANSHQLVVNGAIVASKLYANRTYGTGRGINSIVPAEIVDFDPTLYLWGGAAGGQNNKTENNNKSIVEGDLNVTYINELAPRY